VIEVSRGPEPQALRTLRLAEVPRLSRLARKRGIASDDVKGYRVVAADLWRAHRFKCCYCELQVLQAYNDVEHYRPKASADRAPGSADRHGYWWLAFTWKNLLFACPVCNRSEKNDLFPLDVGSIALAPLRPPPGQEAPLLLDPSVENGVEHIEFVFSVMLPSNTTANRPPGWDTRKHWWPRARRGSKKGDKTIRVCGLDCGDLVELYDAHVNAEVRPVAEDLRRALARGGDVDAAFGRARRLLQPTKPFVGLSYDALRSEVSAAALAPAKLSWPEPRDVGRR
jgi:hypothetical protein